MDRMLIVGKGKVSFAKLPTLTGILCFDSGGFVLGPLDLDLAAQDTREGLGWRSSPGTKLPRRCFAGKL